ncbi:MAG: hypothetical protein ACE5G0_16985 [Rhodothermales bacterium]
MKSPIARLVVPSLCFIMLAGFAGGGCSSSRQQVVQPDYQEKLRGRTTLGVLPLGSDLMPPRAEVQRTPLTRRGHALFYRLFGLTLSDLANVTVLEEGRTFQPEDSTFAYRSLRLSEEDSLTVPVPLTGPVRMDERYPAFLLLIDDLTFAYGTEEGRQALGTLVTEQLIMTATCEYVLWDNMAQQLVGYGRLRVTAPTEAGANVRAPITLLFQRMSASIIRNSPFVLSGQDERI